MQDFTIRQNCRLCGAKSLESVLRLGDTPIGDDYATDPVRNQQTYPLELFRCAECGLFQLSGVIAAEAIYREYLYESSASLGLTQHFRNYAERLTARLGFDRGDFAVDVGSNVGVLLAALAEQGFRVLGFEPAVRIAEKARAAGIDTLCAFFEPASAREIRQERGAARLVTANNVMANVDDMPAFASAVRELLADDGVFVFETGYMPDTVQNLVVDNIYHEHLSYFSVKPLERFFRENGMELFDVERSATKGGSMRGFVQKIGGPRPITGEVGAMANLEIELGFERLGPARAFAIRAERAKNDLLAYLDAYQHGEKLPAYGASVGVTTLLYWLGLADRVDMLLDDCAARQGLFSPGLHIPVRSPEVLVQNRPSRALLLAWRYATPIAARNTAYLDAGGRFVLPLPILEEIVR
jgi:hypothetical protein